MRNRAEWEAQWRRTMARIDAAAPAQPHPADLMDGDDTVEEARIGGEAFLRLLLQLLPSPAHYGGQRRWQAGYHRMCAFAYRLRPDLFPGSTGEQLARTLGISKRAWLKHMAHVEAFFGKNPKNGTRGVARSQKPRNG